MKRMRIRDQLVEPAERNAQEQLRQAAESELFDYAPRSEEAAERTGFSNYSYWGSTFRMFTRMRVALFLLFVLVLLVTFTFVQPLLPGQYRATQVINHPITGMQLSNVAPSTTTVVAQAPKDTQLIITPWENDQWLAVSNVLATLPARTTFTVIDYLDDWVQVELDGRQGYVRNDFTTKLRLPDNPQAVPYESRSNFALKLFSSPVNLTQDGNEVFVSKQDVQIADDGLTATTLREAPLRLLPSEAPFLFGTNNAGQDLWGMVWSGTRTSLFIGFVVAVIEAIIGIAVGVLWGYVRKVDRVLTEIYNVINNIPTTIVLILIAYVLRPGVFTLIFAMTLTGWVSMARFIRNQIVIIRDRDYNLASRCLGTGTWRIITRNLLPYLVSVIMLRMALAIPGAIGSEVFITYIGLGLPLSIPSLGNLITVGRKFVSTPQSYQLIFPTIVLSIVTISFYIIGNSFADAADPRNHV